AGGEGVAGGGDEGAAARPPAGHAGGRMSAPSIASTSHGLPSHVPEVPHGRPPYSSRFAVLSIFWSSPHVATPCRDAGAAGGCGASVAATAGAAARANTRNTTLRMVPPAIRRSTWPGTRRPGPPSRPPPAPTS